MKLKWTLGLLLALPISVLAQGFQTNLQGQKQLGMGGAGVATGLDEATLYYNPGAMAALPENGISVGINTVTAKMAFQEKNSNEVFSNENKLPTPFSLYAVWGPKNAKWKAGIGAYTPFGSTISWGSNWPGNNALTSLQLQAIYIQPTFSYQINKVIGVGAGFVYNYGKVDLQKDLPLGNGTTNGHAQLKGVGSGMGFNVGTQLTFSPKFSVGVTYHSKVETKLTDGDVIFTNIPAGASAGFQADTKFDSTLPLAATLAVGASYKPSPKTIFSLEIDRVFWSSYTDLTFNYSKPVNGATVSTSHRNYKDIFIYRIGAQHQVSDKFTVRGGTYVGLSPVEDGYITPETPDANRLGISAGASYKITKKLNVDATFLYQSVAKRTQENIETKLNGTFATNIFVPGLSLSYKF